MRYRENGGMEGIGGNAEFATVPIVTVAVLRFVPSCVMEVGLTLQLSFAGSVPHERFTANVAPCTGETLIVEVPDWPAGRLRVVGETLIPKSPDGLTTWETAVEVLAAKVESPGY